MWKTDIDETNIKLLIWHYNRDIDDIWLMSVVNPKNYLR